MKRALIVCLVLAGVSFSQAHAADVPQNCIKPVFQDCKEVGTNKNLLQCELELGLIQQGPNTHIYGCETRLTPMSSIVEIQITALRNGRGLALYDFKHNEDVSGRSQVVFSFSRPVEQTDPLKPEAFITVVGTRK